MNSIQRKTLVHWLDHIAKNKVLIAPRYINGVLLYSPISNSTEINWEYIRPVLSVKDAFFPATERLLTIEKSGQDIRINDTFPQKEQVIFGLRSCDARGIAAMDAAFIDEQPTDLNYASRRKNSLLIGLACSELGETCFCTNTGGAPDDPTGMDIMLRKVGDEFKVEVITLKGMEIVKNEWGVQNCEVARRTSQHSNQEAFLSIDKRFWPPQFNSEYWENIAERCLSCRICAYVCPTCRCFDVRDEAIPLENGETHCSIKGKKYFERVRCWDSCASESYRRIAGGHNPRSEKGERLRNRFFCKFYYYPDQYGTQACTGCGRCIDACPVNIDITEVITHIETHSKSLA
jgi:ferredoxin